jgi:tRNA/rRNA methyltransferase
MQPSQPSPPSPPSQASPPADPTRFVLVEPSHPGNVGAAARAMQVMGYADLVLVAPRHDSVLSHADAVALASGATDVLRAGRVVATLGEALDGIGYACATAMTPRDFGPPTHAPRALLPLLAAGTQRVAFVFGSERYGLRNDDVYRCHACLSIPTHPAYGSLNLAQAVQLIAYDWRQAQGGFAVEPRTVDAAWADVPQVQAALEHWRRALVAIGFLDPATPKRLLPRLNRLANRSALTREEVDILRGIARAVERLAVPAGGRAPAGADGDAPMR